MKNCLLLMFFALLTGSAFAQSLPRYSGGPGGGVLYPGSLSDIGSGYRTIAANTSVPGATTISDRVRVGIGAANADMYVNRSISLRNALALGARALPYVGVAAIGYEIFTANRCTITTSGIQCLGPDGASSDEHTYARYMGSAPYGGYSTIQEWGDNNYSTLRQDCEAYFGSGYLPVSWHQEADYLRVYCSAGGALSPFADVQGQDLSPDQVADRLAPHADPNSGPDLVRGALSHGIDASPYAEPLPATGPASLTQPATSSVKTDANGVQSVTTSQVTNNITYQGDTYNVSNTTVLNNPDGSTETTTENPEKSFCESMPNSAACADLGDPGSDKPSWQTKDVLYSADSLGLPAACPAPWSGSVHGWTLSFSYSPICDNAGAIRAGVLALAGLSALFLIITTVKS